MPGVSIVRIKYLQWYGMVFNPQIHHRRSIRLKDYDYFLKGAYFVTLCVQERVCLYGEVIGGDMELNPAGRKVAEIWRELPARFPQVALDESIVMPNHFHGIIVIDDCRGESCIRPSCGKCGHCVQGSKRSHWDWTDIKEKDDQKRIGEQTRKGDHKDRPYGTDENSLGRVMQAFKSLTTHAYIEGVNYQGWPQFPGRLWQRNYFERVFRGQAELDVARRYNLENPLSEE